MKRNNVLFFLFFAAQPVLFSACEKFLDAKSDQRLVIPGNPDDLQALLDNIAFRNNEYSGAPLISSDDYYLPDDAYLTLREDLQRMYTWQNDYVFPTGLYQNDWQTCYQAVYACNTVLDGLADIPKTEQNEAKWNSVKGQALALRAYRFFDAVLVWGLPYDKNTSATDLGIPLRLTADFNIPSQRATVQEVYDQVIADLKIAATLLPQYNINAARPTTAMAYGLLARVYLSMGDYQQAMHYADATLQLNSSLLDYNTLDPDAAYPFPYIENEEVIFFAFGGWNAIATKLARIPADRIASYEPGDLRKALFFGEDENRLFKFKGQYTGSQNPFCGLAVDEILLTRAECRIRAGAIEDGMADLNTLLASRWQTNQFIARNAKDAEHALSMVLDERQKQLIMRGTRWMDLRRFNKEGDGVSLSRMADGTRYKLLPNDPRYALAIPEEVIARTGMPQNAR